MPHQRFPLAIMATTALLALAACGSPQPPTAVPSGTAVPHGYVAGAAEAGEAQTRLAYGSPDAGEISMIDPLTGEEGPTINTTGVQSLQHDGRFVFAGSGPEAPLRVIDTGVWTVDHGDHKHFYSSPASELKSDPELRGGTVAGDGHTVAVFHGDTGSTSILHREDLAQGVVKIAATIPGTPHAGLAVPYKGQILVTGSPGANKLPNTVGSVDPATVPTAAPSTLSSCPALQGHASTRHGVVFGCSDGLLLVGGDAGALTARKIPYPADGPADQAVAFGHRPGSSEVAAVAGTAGLWHLDAATATMQFIASPEPLAVASAAGRGSAVLAVGKSGTLYSFNTTTHEVQSRAGLLPATGQGQAPSLVVDSGRAYLSHPSAKAVHEIDYMDGLRVARTFTTAGLPSQLVETGQ